MFPEILHRACKWNRRQHVIIPGSGVGGGVAGIGDAEYSHSIHVVCIIASYLLGDLGL